MPGRTVAVFTGQHDVTADYVIHELNSRGVPVFRCDPGDFPEGLSVGARSGLEWTGHLRTPVRTLDLTEVGCAWWRRPTPITVSADLPHAEWTQNESRAGVRGLLATLPWLNHPDDIRRAERKPLQLTVAHQVGLSVPPTLLTNDPDEARAFLAAHGQVIYKPLSSGLLDGNKIVYATPVDASHIDDSVGRSMNLFQAAVLKDHELRITVVDGRVFAARIDAGTDNGRQDWRSDYKNLRYRGVELPEPVLAGLVRFMDKMWLRYGAFDMIVTPDGEYVFLECNPNGQWAWIEDETQLPIAKAIADALEGLHA